MAATFITVDAANLFIGTNDFDSNRYLRLRNVSLPDLEEGTREIKPAGAASGLQIGDRTIMPPSITFAQDGWNMDDVLYFMTNQIFTIRASLRDIRSGEDLPVIATVNGRLTKLTQSEIGKGSEPSTEYQINEITLYTLVVNGEEKLHLDWFAGYNGVRRMGRPMFEGVARNLGVV
jgi:hypothetical protein